MTGCLERDVMDRFVAGTASRRECQEVVRHLLAGCGACAAVLRAALRPPIDEGAYDGALARWTAWARAREPAQARCP